MTLGALALGASAAAVLPSGETYLGNFANTQSSFLDHLRDHLGDGYWGIRSLVQHVVVLRPLSDGQPGEEDPVPYEPVYRVLNRIRSLVLFRLQIATGEARSRCGICYLTTATALSGAKTAGRSASRKSPARQSTRARSSG
ncbi:MAG TPA: hypothetical protein VHZ25_12820 [Acidobacteriaceae bacterium]|jgi:hypothetical protein|nr:hypothetical protein [Acidobacteriaceae bacterium]